MVSWLFLVCSKFKIYFECHPDCDVQFSTVGAVRQTKMCVYWSEKWGPKCGPILGHPEGTHCQGPDVCGQASLRILGGFCIGGVIAFRNMPTFS